MGSGARILITRSMIRKAIWLGKRKAEHHNSVHLVTPALSCPSCKRKAM